MARHLSRISVTFAKIIVQVNEIIKAHWRGVMFGIVSGNLAHYFGTFFNIYRAKFPFMLFREYDSFHPCRARRLISSIVFPIVQTSMKGSAHPFPATAPAVVSISIQKYAHTPRDPQRKLFPVFLFKSNSFSLNSPKHFLLSHLLRSHQPINKFEVDHS
jgi:hypothetical protein